MLWVDGQISSSFFPRKWLINQEPGDPVVLVTCENIESDKMDFGVAVLSGLGGGHLNDLAGAVLGVKNE